MLPQSHMHPPYLRLLAVAALLTIAFSIDASSARGDGHESTDAPGTDRPSDSSDGAAVEYDDDGRPIVATRAGKLRGIWVGKANGGRGAADDIACFKGVPFAAPPVGDLRWRPPQPVEAWEDVRDASAFGFTAWQPDGSDLTKQSQPVTKLDEDCLTLNVWTQQLEANEPAPVMVWIHGGGFNTGAGSFDVYNGEHLAREGVVLVTINYRLNIFGFLAHLALSAESELGVSGNYGMLDQIAALEWVRDNIRAFGGDPDNVTIFGESAGGVSVSTLMVMPKAAGLFHRAIAQSGAAGLNKRHLTKDWYDAPSAEAMGVELVDKLGLGDVAEEDLLVELRKVPAKKLLDVADPRVGLFSDGIGFGPAADGVYLPEEPQVLFDLGRQNDVPFMTGTNADEATMFMTGLALSGPRVHRAFVRQHYGDHADAILEYYDAESADDVWDAFNRLSTDALFALPARDMVRAVDASDATSPAYLYHFTRALRAMGKFGATHGMEIGYIFGTAQPWILRSRVDSELATAMRACWVQFARTGNPNSEGLPEWPRYTTSSDAHMVFGDTLAAGKNLREPQLDVLEAWADDLFANGRDPVDPELGNDEDD